MNDEPILFIIHRFLLNISLTKAFLKKMNGKILATVAAKDFIGRERQTETLLRHANGEGKSRGLLVLSAPATGASELLKQTYDRIFSGQSDLIPFYFAVKDSDKTAKNCAVRFLHTFITQITAFRQKDAKIIDVSPDACEIGELAAPEDKSWIDRLITACQIENKINDERTFVRNSLSAPLRACAAGANSFVMIDNVHEAVYFDDDIDFVEEIKEIFNRSNIPFVLAGRRRFLLSAAQKGNARLTDAEVLRMESLDFADAGILAENLAEKYDVKINEPSRDLIARQFGGNPAFIKFILQAASSRKVSLDSFQKVEQIYIDELLGGRIGKFYDSIFQKIAPNIQTQKTIIEILNEASAAEIESDRLPLEEIYKSRKDSVFSSQEVFYGLMAHLNTQEIFRLSANFIEPMSENEILGDYLRARYRLEVASENRASVVGEMLSDFLKRAPQTMAKFYRQSSVINLRELLSVFNCQDAPAGLLDYSVFKEKYKGASETEIPADENEKIRLPQIVYTAYTAGFYAPFSRITEKTRSTVAHGFEDSAYTDENEIVWLAAEIDSKLEASKEAAEFWCDRLEMVALTCNFPKYKIWLVAPEGFAPEALDILRVRNALGSSRRQVELLTKFLGAENKIGKNPLADEYEIVIPMGEDTELIAANAVEEIARRHAFEPKAINQIKTALIEACINATEHSLSPDRKIYQKFTVEDNKIVITISNRGLRFAGREAAEIKSEEGRRGWGLKLMRTLMDEVKIEQVDDGTRISMVKYSNTKR